MGDEFEGGYIFKTIKNGGNFLIWFISSTFAKNKVAYGKYNIQTITKIRIFGF